MNADSLLEQLAAQEHERWSGWMRWMFANWTTENVARWKQQMQTAYADLPEHSKESDRKEARKTLALLREKTVAPNPTTCPQTPEGQTDDPARDAEPQSIRPGDQEKS